MRERREAEREAGEVAPRLRRRAPSVGDLHDGDVPAGLRRPVEEWACVDLSGVGLDTHTDPRTVAGAAGRVAAFDGATSTVYAGLAAPLAGTALAQDILIHELVHAAQARADDVDGGGARPGRRVPALRLGFCEGTPAVDPLDTLRSGKKLSAAEAKALLDHYEGLGGPERDKVVAEFHKTGVADSGVRRLLEGLDPAELQARRALVSDLQERVQRLAVEATAGKSISDLGAAQGAHMKAEAEKRALAAAAAEAAKKGAPAPKAVPPADVAKAHEAETKRTSPVTKTVTNAWDALLPPAQAAWNARAAAVITKVVDACKKKAPELGVAAANLKWAPREVAQEGSNVYAFSGNPISFGMSFVETAEADPEYAVRVVVHEIEGHPAFGDRFKSSEAQIYAEAHKKEPTLGAPWDTQEETNTFGYIGTEIYAALREVPYEKPLTAAHAKAGLITAIDPAANVDNKVWLVKTKYAPGAAEAVVQGLYERFRVDPRITPKALDLYVRMVEKHFGKKVLKK
jgi:hypothetical protein